ncbi:MAG: tail fiber domain-containing protein, partial [Bdellovibrionaceae bacterium]|nr:tail fiber domain-containing protein [Pseudobdellovibrionaceae bacterium]
TMPSISISQATTSTDGYLSSADWNMFNGKASASSLNNYVLKAGDTMTGALALPSNGLTVGTNQLTVSGGNVGVGTTNPSRKLHVRADGAYQLRLENASAGGGYWNIAQSDSTFGSGGQKLLFIPDVDTSTSATVVFTNAGRVGIGNINPTESLDVTGKIKGTELCIGTDCRASWPTGAGGTVTSVTSANTDISVATTTTTPILTLNTGTGANQILKLNGSSEIPAVSGANLTNLNASSLTSGTLSAARLPALTGDVTSSAGSNSITLNTVPVSKGGTGSTTIQANKLVSTGATGTAWTPFSCAAGEVVKFDGSGVLGCSTIATMLGYTPANGANYVSKSGDTISGGLTIDGPAQGLTLKSSGDHVYLGLFADADAPSTRSGWVGYGTAGTSNLTIANEMTGGPIHLSTASTPRMAIDANGGVGIGTTSPNASSLLEVTSTTKGFLPPRMTRAQRNAISSPAQGLMVFNTDDNTIDYYNGAAWLALNGSPKYIKMLMSNYQTIGAGSIVTFDTVAVNSGFTTTGYGINLKAGVTYRLEAMLNTYAATGNNYVGYQLHNGTSYIGQAAYSSESEQTSYGFKAGVMEIYKPTVDQTITLRIMDANLGTGQVTPYYNTYLIATELVPAGPAGGGGNDNLGNHTASQNINLGTNWISPDGTAKGLRLAANGSLGVNNAAPTEALDVTGKVKATELCIGADCRAAWPSGAGGTVTSVTSANADIAIATTTTTPVLTLNTGTGANQILKLNASSEIPAVSGANLTNLNASNLASGTLPVARLPALTGDVTSTAGSNSITLNTVPVSKGGTGSTTIQANKLVSTGATGTAWTPFSCAVGEVVKFDGSGVLGCATIAGMLGYTPANGTNYVAKSGDTMTGTLSLPGDGLVVGTNQIVATGGRVGLGTNSPLYQAHIFGAGQATAALTDAGNKGGTLYIQDSGGSGGNGGAVVFGDGHGQFAAIKSLLVNGSPNVIGDLAFSTRNAIGDTALSERMRILSNGNVGIGTSTPGARFEVAGDILMSGAGNRYLNTTSDHLRFNKKAGTYNFYFSKSTNGGNDYTGLADLMVIQDNGNVGIGTASPTQKLHLSSGDTSYALFGPNATWNSYLKVGAGNISSQANVASVISTNGNLHLDASAGGQSVYIAHVTASNTFMNLNGGNVGIGSSNPNAKLTIGAGSQNGITSYISDGTYHAVHGNNQATGVWGSLGYSNYGVYCIGNCGGNTGWNNFSDRRLKEHISPLKSSLEKVTSLQGVEYDWKDEKQRKLSGHQIGLIAQDVEKVFPEAVKTDKNNKQLEGGVKSLEYTMLIAPMIEAIKELHAKVQKMFSGQEQIQREVASVKAENEKLKQENAAIKAYLCAKDPKAPICQSEPIGR